jgi:hypothetical protein
MAAVMEDDDDRRQERARQDDDPAEQGTRGDRDLPPNVQRERPHDDDRQSER